MAVHNSDQGATWSNMEALSVNEPHGLDYRQHNAIAAGVRKRMLKEHLEFTDSTVGGEHLPGVARVINKDTSANIDTSWGSGYLRGSGLQWNPTTGRFYCATIDGSDDGVADMTVIGYSPWADATWTGNHEFKSQVRFDGTVDFSKAVKFDASVDFSKALGCNHLYCNSTSDFYDTVSINAAMVANYIQVSQDITIDGTAICGAGLIVDGTASIGGNLKVAGDISMVDISGNARQRLATAWGRNVYPSTVADGYNVANMDRSSAGTYCVSFTTNLLDANYAVIATPHDSTLEQAGMHTCYSMVVSGFKVKIGTSGGTPMDVSGFSIIVFGGN